MAPIPIQVMVQNIIPVEDIETQLCALLPVVSKVISVDKSNCYTDLASRGLFVYDWTDIYHISSEKLNKYELVSYPAVPITKKSLDGNLLKLAQEIQINASFFNLKENFSPEDFFECIYPDKNTWSYGYMENYLKTIKKK